MLANPPEPPKINWEEYQKTVPVAGLVDKLKSAYESFKVPFPVDSMSVKVDEQWRALQPVIKAYCDEQQTVIDRYEKTVTSEYIISIDSADKIHTKIENGSKVFDD